MTAEVKRRPGRPKMADRTKRTNTVKVQFTPAEREVIEKLASPRKLSAYLRDKGLAQ